MSKNIVIVEGLLARDAEVKYTQNGKCLLKFTIGIRSEAEKGSNNFVSCMAWGDLAEQLANSGNGVKGNIACVLGYIKTGSYQNKQGQRVYTTDVVAEHAVFTERKGNSFAGGGSESNPAASFGNAIAENPPEGIDF